MLAPFAGAVTAEGVRQVERAGRLVRLLELAHAFGHLREREKVGGHRKVIDGQVQLADDVINACGKGFRRNQILEGEVQVGVAGAGRAMGERNQSVDDVGDGVEVLQRQRQKGVAQYAVLELDGGVVGEWLGVGGVVGESGVDGAVASKLPDLGGGDGAEGGQALHQVGADGYVIGVHGRRDVPADPVQHGAEANGAGHVARSGPRHGDDAGRVLNGRQVDVLDFQQRRSHRGGVLDDQRPLVHNDGGKEVLGVGGGEYAGQVAAAVVVDDEAQLRPVQLELADGDGALGEPLLVVVDDGGRDVEEILAIQSVGTGDAQFVDGDAAEEAEAGRNRGRRRRIPR